MNTARSKTSENVKPPTLDTHESNPTSQYSTAKEQKDVASEKLQCNIHQENSKRKRHLEGSNLATGYSSDPVNINNPRTRMQSIMGFFSFLTNFKTHLHAGFALRVALVLYGDHKDSISEVKFTDVDYRVFTDAARHIYHDGSPYERHTYRYTPLLAWMLIPNINFTPLFGKFLFSAFDIIAAHLIYSYVRAMLKSMAINQSYFKGIFGFDCNPETIDTWARRCAYLWLYNPLVMTVSARGNAESIVVTLVLATLHLYQERVFFLTGIALGMAIHFKIYPIIFTLPLYSALTVPNSRTGEDTIANYFRSLFDFNRARVRLVLGTFLTFTFLTIICYAGYGWEFLEESYLHHMTRRDTRHNFSVYFYMLYLTVEDDDIGISLLTFLPQFLLLLAISKQFGRNPEDLPFCLFAQTFVFVAYNKVVTSQYFLWYLSLIPLVIPKLKLSKYESVTSLLLWGFTQASWLLPAYFLEFKGYNTFQFVWIESLAFFAANIGLLSKFVRKYREIQATIVDEKLQLLQHQRQRSTRPVEDLDKVD